MDAEEKFIRSLRDFNSSAATVFPVTVDSVDMDQMTCDVSPVNDAELFDVRLKAAINGNKDGLIEVPSVGSSALVCLIDKKPDRAFIIKVDSVSEVLFYGGKNGGLIKVNELVNQLNKLKAVVDKMQDALLNWVPNPTDGGGALKFQLLGLEQLEKASFEKLENEKVKH